MGFSRKQNQQSGGNGGASQEAWAAWKEHCHEQHPAKKSTKAGKGGKKDRKQSVVPVICNYVQDLGFPPAPDNMWPIDPTKNKKMEGHEPPTDADGNLDYSDGVYSYWEVAFLQEHPEADFVWDNEWNDTEKKSIKVRKQTSPAQPSQEYGVCVDVPSWLVDFSKHPKAPEDAPEDLRPMRISLNGNFKGEIGSPITFETDFRTKEIRETNLIRKICAAASRDQELRESDWDIGVVAGAVCNMQVTSDFAVDGEYTNHNTSASKPSIIEDLYHPMDEDELIASADSIIKKAENTKGLAPFTGVLLTMAMEDYTDELLSMVHSTGTAHFFNKRMEMSAKFTISGTNKAGKEYSFEKGTHLTDEHGEELWADGKPVFGDYEDTNFAKAYEKWKQKKDKEQGKSGGNSSSKASGKASSGEGKQTPKEETKATQKAPEKESPKVNASKPQPVSEPEPMDFDDDLPF